MKIRYFTAAALMAIMSFQQGDAKQSTPAQISTRTEQARISYDEATVLIVIKDKICDIKPPLLPPLIHESDNLATSLGMDSFDKRQLFDYLNDYFDIDVIDEDWALCSTVGDVKRTVLINLP